MFKCAPNLIGLIFLSLMLACRADPAPDSGFLDTPAALHEEADLPFNAAWRADDLDWSKYKKILIRPVDTTHLLKMSWWDKASIANAVISPEEEAVELAEYMRDELIEEFKSDPKKRFEVVDTADVETIVLETAIVEVVPTKVWLNTISYVLIGALDFGTVAMEGRFVDGITNHKLMKFKDREHGQMAIVSVADLQWYAHAHHIIDRWAEQIRLVSEKAPDEPIAPSWTVTLKPW